MPSPVVRFFRVVIAFALAAGIDTALANLGILELPPILVPVIAALLAATGKWLRERFPEVSGFVPV